MKKRILYIAYNGLTPEIYSYLAKHNFFLFDIKVIVPHQLNLYGQIIDFNTARKAKKIEYIPFSLINQPYTFFDGQHPNQKLNKIIKDFSPDLIIVHNELFHPNALAVINSKLQYSPHSKILNFVASQYLPTRIEYFKKYFYYQKMLKHTDFLCCRNKKEWQKLQHIKLLKGIKIFYNYWGVDRDCFYKINDFNKVANCSFLKKISWLKNEKNFILGFAGRIVEEKGLHIIIESMKHLSGDYYLVYCGQWGDNKYREEIKTIIHKNNLSHRCYYLGNIKYERLVYFYNFIDLLIVPTIYGKINFVELFGRVIPEAMLCKALVIGSNNGSIPEVLNNKSLIFRQNNILSLVKIIQKMRNLEETEKNKIIQEGYNYALENYTSNQYVARLESFIQENL